MAVGMTGSYTGKHCVYSVNQLGQNETSVYYAGQNFEVLWCLDVFNYVTATLGMMQQMGKGE